MKAIGGYTLIQRLEMILEALKEKEAA